MPVKVDFQVLGTKEIQKRLEKMSVHTRPEARKALQRIAGLTAGISVDRYLSGPRPEKLGRITGVLAATVGGSGQVRQEGDDLIAEFGSKLSYAKIHEDIGVGHAKRKRPFLKPAVRDAWREGIIERQLKKLLTELLRAAS